MKMNLFMIVFMGSVTYIHTAKILAVFPFPGKSHYIFESAVLKALAQRGHLVVEYSPFPPQKPVPNITHVNVHTHYVEEFDNWDFAELQKYTQYTNVFGLHWLTIWDFILPVCDEVFKNENISKLLESKEHFDLVLTSATFAQESMLVFGHKFRAPTVTLQGFRHSVALNRDSGNSLMIATIPNSMTLPFTDRMTFVERLRNFVSSSITLFTYYFSHLPKQEGLIKKYYKSDTPSLVEMVSNVSLTLVNTHHAVSYPQPFTPNVIPIGGITVTPERVQLPRDIQRFMDDAKEGVIYFSFGTVVSTHLMPQNKLQVFINVFRKLPQKVLWKIEANVLPGLSKNVKLSKWVPQPGVLGHPNCAVFITHGGLFSQLEAYHAGVPIIGIPLFADQFFNVRFNEERGVGIKVDFETLTEASLISALTSVLNNTRYKENAVRLSHIFQVVPMSPADTAVFWTEYVLRHAGATHLRPVASSLTLYQYLLIDVAAVILVTCVIVIFIFHWSIKKVFSFLFIKRNSTLKHDKKND